MERGALRDTEREWIVVAADDGTASLVVEDVGQELSRSDEIEVERGSTLRFDFRWAVERHTHEGVDVPPARVTRTARCGASPPGFDVTFRVMPTDTNEGLMMGDYRDLAVTVDDGVTIDPYARELFTDGLYVDVLAQEPGTVFAEVARPSGGLVEKVMFVVE